MEPCLEVRVMRRFGLFVLACLAVGLWTVAGCQQSGSNSGTGESGGQQEQQQQGSGTTTTGSEAEGLAALSPEDRALAEKQGVCPVSGEALGEMGTPVKVEVDGKVVFLCCDHCRGKFDENPQEYLAKVEGAAQEGGEQEQQQ